VAQFFVSYKELEGKKVEIVGWGKSEEATRLITRSIEQYDRAYLTVGP
jgi:inorganic pyrophosphatase